MPGHRPSKRTLVRWNDDLDKEVLLAVQYACAETGIKIPWNRVAEVMGQEFSEGSVVQHLAKIRQKMVENGLHVPPPMRRGMVTKQPSKIYATPSKFGTTTTESTSISKAVSTRRGVRSSQKPTTKGKAKRSLTDDEDEVLEEPSLYDSDSDYGSKRKKTKITFKARSDNSDTEEDADHVEQNVQDANNVDSEEDSADGEAEETEEAEEIEEVEEDEFHDDFEPEHVSRRRAGRRKKTVGPDQLHTDLIAEATSRLIRGANIGMNDLTTGIGDQFTVPALLSGPPVLPNGQLDFNSGNNFAWMPSFHTSMQQNPFWGMTMPQLAPHGYIPPVFTNPYAEPSQPESFEPSRNNSSLSGSTIRAPHQFQSTMPTPSTPLLNPGQPNTSSLQNRSTDKSLDEDKVQQEESAAGAASSFFDEQFDMGNYGQSNSEA